MAESLFKLQDLSKSYQGRSALAIGRLEFASGQVTAVQGPNGSGKTTLLMILARLLRPDKGKLFYRGKELKNSENSQISYRREVTLVAQDSYLFNTTVERNIGYGLGIRGKSPAQRRQAAVRALASVGLSGFAGRRARELSAGEARRVALARALALAPRVLLLDEPFANLDPESAEVFERVIGGLPQSGCDVILVTHGREQARRLASRVLVLDQGKIA